MTVNTAEQVTLAWQDEVTVQVTVVDPPQAGGAPVLLLLICPSQPPVKLAVESQLANAEFTDVCV